MIHLRISILFLLFFRSCERGEKGEKFLMCSVICASKAAVEMPSVHENVIAFSPSFFILPFPVPSIDSQIVS